MQPTPEKSTSPSVPAHRQVSARSRVAWGAGLLALVVLIALVTVAPRAPSSTSPTKASSTQISPAPSPALAAVVTPATGIHKIKHVVIIMQENRSFDSYFGTYPGANGIPKVNGVFTPCNPRPAPLTGCERPYHNSADVNSGADHTHPAAVTAIAGGKMNGFVQAAEKSPTGCVVVTDPACAQAGKSDVMGYHDAREIPNYWTYAKNFVLQDRLFEPTSSWSYPSHLYMVSGWSATCATTAASSCSSNIGRPYSNPGIDTNVTQAMNTGSAPITNAWTDITYQLYNHHVSWGYYIESGTQPDCADDAATCSKVAQDYRTPGIWNPLPLFSTVQQDHQIKNVQPLTSFLAQAKAGTLPAVSWVTPSEPNSEHPPASIKEGEAYTTKLINNIMHGPDWASTAIFLSWDDWGGFYDHVNPPQVDVNGYGLRVPGLVLSPYAKKGYIDHQSMSQDAYLKFIEDDFLSGARLDPATDGRPDPRPSVRETEPQVGNLALDFNFNQTPRPALLLPLVPAVAPCLYGVQAGLPAQTMTCFNVTHLIANVPNKVYAFGAHHYKVHAANGTDVGGWLDGRVVNCTAALYGQCRYA